MTSPVWSPARAAGPRGVSSVIFSAVVVASGGGCRVASGLVASGLVGSGFITFGVVAGGNVGSVVIGGGSLTTTGGGVTTGEGSTTIGAGSTTTCDPPPGTTMTG